MITVKTPPTDKPCMNCKDRMSEMYTSCSIEHCQFLETDVIANAYTNSAYIWKQSILSDFIAIKINSCVISRK
jgi:hypothetical protein